MKYIKLFEKFYLEDSELIITGDNTDNQTKKQYPFIRVLKIRDLKKLENFPNYKKFLDEIFKGKLIKPYWLPKFKVRNIKIVDQKIVAYLSNNTFNILDLAERVIIYHETKPQIGEQEKLANEFLEIIKDVNKYNL